MNMYGIRWVRSLRALHYMHGMSRKDALDKLIEAREVLRRSQGSQAVHRERRQAEALQSMIERAGADPMVLAQARAKLLRLTSRQPTLIGSALSRLRKLFTKKEKTYVGS
jgi:hypothetical protein